MLIQFLARKSCAIVDFKKSPAPKIEKKPLKSVNLYFCVIFECSLHLD